MGKTYVSHKEYLRARREARLKAREARERSGGRWQDGNFWTGDTERLQFTSPPDDEIRIDPIRLNTQYDWVNADWTEYDRIAEYN